MSIQVIHADCRDALREIPDASIDACVTDPPYALVSIGKRFGADDAAPCKEGKTGAYARASRGFMGKKWDTGEAAFDPATWREVLRVLKPGGHLIAFGGTRTYHRLACAVEDAGFEIRDMIAWLYGSGFPKSHDVSKGIDRAAGLTREVVSQGAPVKRMIPGADQAKQGWEKNNGREYVPTETAPASTDSAAWEGWGTALKPALEPIVLARKPLIGTVAGNVLKHGTGALNIDASRVEGMAQPFHNGSGRSGGIMGENRPGRGLALGNPDGRWPANVIHDGSDEVVAAFPESDGGGSISNRASPKTKGVYGAFAGEPERWSGYEDAGTAARFFYSAKADAGDRLESKHPTVKPVDLIAYLTRLVTPPGGTVLDLFAGSGTLGMACMREGFNAILIEREAEYVADIKRRIAHVHGDDTPLFAEAAA